MSTAEERIREAECVRDVLGVAFAGVGVKLPSFGIDQVSCAREDPYPLIELGRCDVATARMLAEALLRVGSTVRDEETGRVGEVMGHEGGRVQLRPLLGGREWDARPDRVRPVTATDLLSARVAAVNSLPRRGGSA